MSDESTSDSTSDEQPDTGTEKAPTSGPFAGSSRFARWGPNKRLAYLRLTRMMREQSARFWEAKDPERNEDSRIPVSERVEMPAVWIAEIYSPSTVDGLLGGLRRLGWDRGQTRRESLIQWMADVRDGRRAGWINLGVVSPPQAPSIMRERTAVLPEGVHAAMPTLASLTSSLTVLVVQFILTEEAAMALDEPLRRDYRTHLRQAEHHRIDRVVAHVLWNRPLDGSYSIEDPDFQRRRDNEKAIRGMESACSDWVTSNLPGAFADSPKDILPSSVLLVTEVVSPLTPEARRIRALNIAGLGRDFDTWESSEWPGARMTMGGDIDEDRSRRLLFACRRRDAFPAKSGYPDPESNWTIAARANDHIGGLHTRWALTCLLDTYHQILSNRRDRSAAQKTHRPVRDLEDLRGLVRTSLYDMLLSATEIEAFSKSAFYDYEVMDMTYVRDVRGTKPELTPGLKEGQEARSRQVESEARLLLSTLSASADVTQAISNIRLQRLLVVLTVLSLIVAAIAIVVAGTS